MEVTCRTLHGRHLLRPARKLNRIVLGVLGRSQRKYPVRILAFVFLSNHYHLLLWVPNAERLARFMNYFSGNLARELGRLQHWREKIWSRRYQSIVVSDEPAAQIARLEYILAHGVKEGLVPDPRTWPGVHCVHALLERQNPRGIWYDRTRAYNSRVRGERLPQSEFACFERVEVSPLPCWEGVAPRDLVSNILELLERIQRARPATARARAASSKPAERPGRLKRSPAPWFHCASSAARRELLNAYHVFRAAYRDAAERLVRGDPGVLFPEGSFPPALPFVS